MRYIADSSGYVKEVSFGADITCGGQDCLEYTGGVPTGYTSLEAWYIAEVEKLYRWKIVSGQLTLDSAAVAPTESNAPGQLYESYITSKSIPNTTVTTLTNLTVPAGAYVIVGWVEFVSYGSVTNYQIRLNDPNNTFSAYDRSYNGAGGGHTVTRVQVFTEETTVRLQTYQGTGSSQNMRARLQIMRVA